LFDGGVEEGFDDGGLGHVGLLRAPTEVAEEAAEGERRERGALAPLVR
jgi:hypothetical protein